MTNKRVYWQRFCFYGIVIGAIVVSGCGVIKTTYKVTKGTVVTTYKGAKLATKLTAGTVKLTYKLGKFTFDVVTAPLDWPMTRDIETIDGISPKEAVRQGRVKNSPYVVRGRRYTPYSIEAASRYKQVGIASWYGRETLRQPGGYMTANGERFDPSLPTAAHKHLPLPMHAKVTNLDNGRSMLVRVNDRGPFVDGRIIDLTEGAAKELGFYRQGTARVMVEAVAIN